MTTLLPVQFGIPGGPELLVILLIAVLLFGANKIPKLARSTGEAMGEFQKGRQEVEEELKEMRDGSTGDAPETNADADPEPTAELETDADAAEADSGSSSGFGAGADTDADADADTEAEVDPDAEADEPNDDVEIAQAEAGTDTETNQ